MRRLSPGSPATSSTGTPYELERDRDLVHDRSAAQRPARVLHRNRDEQLRRVPDRGPPAALGLDHVAPQRHAADHAHPRAHRRRNAEVPPRRGARRRGVDAAAARLVRRGMLVSSRPATDGGATGGGARSAPRARAPAPTRRRRRRSGGRPARPASRRARRASPRRARGSRAQRSRRRAASLAGGPARRRRLRGGRLLRLSLPRHRVADRLDRVLALWLPNLHRAPPFATGRATRRISDPDGYG